MSGHVGDLSPSQEQALAQFRENMADALKPKHDDHLLLQFLRARNFDLKKSEDMLRRHFQWRETFDEDFFLNEYEPPQFLLEYMVPSYLGYDKGGSPIRVINAGPADIKGLTACFKRLEIKRCITWFLDCDKRDLNERNKKTGVHVETRTFIFDLKGISLRQLTHKDVVDLVISFLKLYEYNYPENLKVAYVINTPPFFAWLYNLIKTLLSEDTVKKVRIFGSSGWKEKLLEEIDADVLPAVYGGTRTDPNGDPRCATIISQGGPIPPQHYPKNQRRLSGAESGARRVVVGRRSKHAAPFGEGRTVAAGAELAWEVDCKDLDVQVSLLYAGEEEGESGCKGLMEPVRVSSEFGVETGTHVAQRNGTYLLLLDNSYSILRSKTVYFKTSVSETETPDIFSLCPE